jgi:hypothetical protein
VYVPVPPPPPTMSVSLHLFPNLSAVDLSLYVSACLPICLSV